jgi:hypothetical protein
LGVPSTTPAAVVLADQRAERDAEDGRQGDAVDDLGDGRRLLLRRHGGDGDLGRHREEQALGQGGDHARHHEQGVVVGQGAADGGHQGQRHDGDQEGAAGDPPGEHGEHWAAHGDGHGVSGHQQACGRHVHTEVGGDLGEYADDDELGCPHSECAEHQDEGDHGADGKV